MAAAVTSLFGCHSFPAFHSIGLLEEVPASGEEERQRSPPRRCTDPAENELREARSIRGVFAPWTAERRSVLDSRPARKQAMAAAI